jgi:hypothetical protein
MNHVSNIISSLKSPNQKKPQLSSGDNSKFSIIGNSSAHYVYETQIIRNNDKHQLFATQNSFPFDFKWNAIYD